MTLALLGAGIAGLMAGVGHFAGLWATVRRLPSARRPALLLWGSFLIRTALCVGVFIVVAGERWERWLACLAGFLAGRQLVLAARSRTLSRPERT